MCMSRHLQFTVYTYISVNINNLDISLQQRMQKYLHKHIKQFNPFLTVLIIKYVS